MLAWDQRGKWFGEGLRRRQAEQPTPLGFGQTAAYTKTQGVTSWPQQLGDISWAIEQAAILHPGVPLYLFGHSMGGGLSLAFPTRTPPLPGLEQIKGVVASAPLLRQAKGVKANVLVVKAGALLGKLSGKLTLSAPVKAEVSWSSLLLRRWLTSCLLRTSAAIPQSKRRTLRTLSACSVARSPESLTCCSA